MFRDVVLPSARYWMVSRKTFEHDSPGYCTTQCDVRLEIGAGIIRAGIKCDVPKSLKNFEKLWK
jgi:hypothetical protein